MNQYTDPTQHIFWLASRSLGIVAIILLAASVGFGLLLSGRVLKQRGMAVRLKNMHEALALTAMGAIAGHGLALLGDKYLDPGLAGIAIPFVMPNQPVWTGIGIIAGWLAAIFTFSFYVRKLIGNKTWRWLHRWTLAAYLLAVGHTIGSGTDGSSTWMLALLAVISMPIVFGLAFKLAPDSRRGPEIGPDTPRRVPRPRPEAVAPGAQAS